MNSSARAIRYRRLALAEKDKANAALLFKIADECDRGLLYTAEWLGAARSFRNNEPALHNEPVRKAAEANWRFVWDSQ